MKAEYKKIQSNLRRCKSSSSNLTLVHFLINIKSHHIFSSIYKSKEVRLQLGMVKDGKKSNNGDVKFWFIRKFPNQTKPLEFRPKLGMSAMILENPF